MDEKKLKEIEVDLNKIHLGNIWYRETIRSLIAEIRKLVSDRENKMAEIYKPLELTDKYGKGSGRYRMVKYSDEDVFMPYPLCSCNGGHSSKDEARKCPEAKAETDRYFGPSESRGVALETLDTMIELLKGDDKYQPSRELLLTILTELKATKS